MPHVILRIFVFFFSIILLSCSEKSDVSPQNIIGVYAFDKVSGTVTIAGKKSDISKIDDLIEGGDEIEFKENGIGYFDNDKFEYSLSGKDLKITQDGISIYYQVNISGSSLALTFDKKGYASLIEIFNEFAGIEKITELEGVLFYTKLDEDAYAVPKVPECLVELDSYKNISYNYIYDKFGIISSVKINSGNNETVQLYTKYPENIGSETEPYVIRQTGGSQNKYFCNRNGRVSKIEIFNNAQQRIPSQTSHYVYDLKGRIKSTTIEVYNGSSNSTLKYLWDYVYDIKEEYKIYETRLDSKDNIILDKYLYMDRGYTDVLNKSIVVFPYHYGNSTYDKYYPKFSNYYNTDGSISYSYEYAYTFDNQGYKLTSTSIYKAGAITSENPGTFKYSCK